MPSTAVVAAAVVGLLVVAGVGVGLGVGLTRDNDDGDNAPVAGASTAQSQGTRGLEGGTLGTEDPVAPTEAESPTDPTFAFSPRAFGGELAPDSLAPDSLAPAPIAPAPATRVAPATAPLGPRIARAPVAEVPVPVPAPAPAPVPVPAPAPAPEVEAPVPAPLEAPTPAPEVVEEPPLAAFDEDILTESGAVLGDGVAPGPDGKYAVCPGSWEQRDWPEQPCGVTVNPDGTVILGEYFGGFDGYFAVDPADGHENCFNWAVTQMFQQPICETVPTELGPSCVAVGNCVCFAYDKENPPIEKGNWPANEGIIKFLKDLRDEAAPTDWEFPEDQALADGGGRQANVDKVTAVFQSKIVIADNC